MCVCVCVCVCVCMCVCVCLLARASTYVLIIENMIARVCLIIEWNLLCKHV